MKKMKTKDIHGKEIELFVCRENFEIPDVLPTDIKVDGINGLMTKKQVIDMLRSVLIRLVTSNNELDYPNIMPRGHDPHHEDKCGRYTQAQRSAVLKDFNTGHYPRQGTNEPS